MKEIRTITVLILLSFAFCSWSCTKSLEDKIEGKWKKTELGTPTGSYYTWEFDVGNFAIYYFNASTGLTTLDCYGQYTAKHKILGKRIIDVYQCTKSHWQSKYIVESVNSSNLTLTKDQGPLEYLEFTKL